MQDLVAFGEVRRARLGIQMGEVTPVDAELYGLPRAEGALVQNVMEDAPAGRAGLLQEDVIVGVDGVDVGYPAQLQSAIAQKRPGDEVRIAYYRDRARHEVTVRLDQAPLTPRPRETVARETAVEELLGIEVGSPDAATAERWGYSDAEGVFVLRVNPTSVAARAGVAPGARVLGINRQPVTSVDEARTLLEGLDGGQIVTFQLGSPDGDSRIVNVQVPGMN
jgi:S1-C subfamily serine protease